MSEELNKGDAAFNALARARSRNSKFRNQTTPKRRPRFGRSEEIATHVSIDVFNADTNELILRTDSTAWATQIRLLSSDLKRRIALEVGDGVVKTLKIYGPTQPKQKGLWRVPTMGKKDY